MGYSNRRWGIAGFMTGESRNRAQVPADPRHLKWYVRPWMIPALAAGPGLVISAIPATSSSAFKPQIMFEGPSIVDSLGSFLPLSESIRRMAVGVARIYWGLGLFLFLARLISTHKEEHRNCAADLLLM
jgi:hypothetical protein